MYALSIFEKINYQEFDEAFIKILNKHAPIKNELVRTNQAPYRRKLNAKQL